MQAITFEYSLENANGKTLKKCESLTNAVTFIKKIRILLFIIELRYTEIKNYLTQEQNLYLILPI